MGQSRYKRGTTSTRGFKGIDAGIASLHRLKERDDQIIRGMENLRRSALEAGKEAINDLKRKQTTEEKNRKVQPALEDKIYKTQKLAMERNDKRRAQDAKTVINNHLTKADQYKDISETITKAAMKGIPAAASVVESIRYKQARANIADLRKPSQAVNDSVAEIIATNNQVNANLDAIDSDSKDPLTNLSAIHKSSLSKNIANAYSYREAAERLARDYPHLVQATLDKLYTTLDDEGKPILDQTDSERIAELLPLISMSLQNQYGLGNAANGRLQSVYRKQLQVEELILKTSRNEYLKQKTKRNWNTINSNFEKKDPSTLTTNDLNSWATSFLNWRSDTPNRNGIPAVQTPADLRNHIEEELKKPQSYWARNWHILKEKKWLFGHPSDSKKPITYEELMKFREEDINKAYVENINKDADEAAEDTKQVQSALLKRFKSEVESIDYLRLMPGSPELEAHQQSLVTGLRKNKANKQTIAAAEAMFINTSGERHDIPVQTQQFQTDIDNGLVTSIYDIPGNLLIDKSYKRKAEGSVVFSELEPFGDKIEKRVEGLLFTNLGQEITADNIPRNHPAIPEATTAFVRAVRKDFISNYNPETGLSPIDQYKASEDKIYSQLEAGTLPGFQKDSSGNIATFPQFDPTHKAYAVKQLDLEEVTPEYLTEITAGKRNPFLDQVIPDHKLQELINIAASGGMVRYSPTIYKVANAAGVLPSRLLTEWVSRNPNITDKYQFAPNAVELIRQEAKNAGVKSYSLHRFNSSLNRISTAIKGMAATGITSGSISGPDAMLYTSESLANAIEIQEEVEQNYSDLLRNDSPRLAALIATNPDVQRNFKADGSLVAAANIRAVNAKNDGSVTIVWTDKKNQRRIYFLDPGSYDKNTKKFPGIPALFQMMDKESHYVTGTTGNKRVGKVLDYDDPNKDPLERVFVPPVKTEEDDK